MATATSYTQPSVRPNRDRYEATQSTVSSGAAVTTDEAAAAEAEAEAEAESLEEEEEAGEAASAVESEELEEEAGEAAAEAVAAAESVASEGEGLSCHTIRWLLEPDTNEPSLSRATANPMFR